MYLMDYEEAVMAYLRILKYLHMYNPERVRFAADRICSAMDDDLYSKLYEALFALVDNMYDDDDDDGGSYAQHIGQGIQFNIRNGTLLPFQQGKCGRTHIHSGCLEPGQQFILLHALLAPGLRHPCAD